MSGRQAATPDSGSAPRSFGVVKVTSLSVTGIHGAGGSGGQTSVRVQCEVPTLCRQGMKATGYSSDATPEWREVLEFPFVRDLGKGEDHAMEITVCSEAGAELGHASVGLGPLREEAALRGGDAPEQTCELTGPDGQRAGRLALRLHYTPAPGRSDDGGGKAPSGKGAQSDTGPTRPKKGAQLDDLPVLPQTLGECRDTDNRGEWQVLVDVLQVRGLVVDGHERGRLLSYVVIGVAGAAHDETAADVEPGLAAPPAPPAPDAAAGARPLQAALRTEHRAHRQAMDDMVFKSTLLEEGRAAWFDAHLAFVVQHPLRMWWGRHLKAEVWVVARAAGQPKGATQRIRVGTASFTFAELYRRPGHGFRCRWVAVTAGADDPRVRGFVQLSVAVLGPADEVPEHPAEPGAGDEEAIVPPRAVYSHALLTTQVYHAEGIPQVDSSLLADVGITAAAAWLKEKFWGEHGEGPVDRADPYVTVRFDGEPAETPPILSSYRPVWYKALHLPIVLPSFSDSVRVQLMDSNQWLPSTVIATHFLQWSRLTHGNTRLPRLGAHFIHFYGAPRGDNNFLSQQEKRMNQGLEVGACYRGRLLLGLSSRPLLDKKVGTARSSDTLPRAAAPKFLINNYSVVCHIYHGSMLPSGGKYKVELSIGEYYARTGVQAAASTCNWQRCATRTGVDERNANWGAEWYEELEIHSRWEALFPGDGEAAPQQRPHRYAHALPDVVLTLLDESNKRIGFTRFNSTVLLEESNADKVHFRDANPGEREFGGHWGSAWQRRAHLRGAHVMFRLPGHSFESQRSGGLNLYVCSRPFAVAGKKRKHKIRPELQAAGEMAEESAPYGADGLAPTRVRRLSFDVARRKLHCYFTPQTPCEHDPWVSFTLPSTWHWHGEELLSSDHFKERSLAELLAAFWRLGENAKAEGTGGGITLTWLRDGREEPWPPYGVEQEHVCSSPRRHRRWARKAFTVPVGTLLTPCSAPLSSSPGSATGMLTGSLGLFYRGPANSGEPRAHRFDGPSKEQQSWAKECQELRAIEADRKSRDTFPGPPAPGTERDRIWARRGRMDIGERTADTDSASYWVVLRAFVYRAVDLRPTELNGLADPYVRVCFGDQVAETAVCPKTLNPTFGETLELLVRGPKWSEFGVPLIVVEVWDSCLLRDECIGRASCAVPRPALGTARAAQLPELVPMALTLPTGGGGYAGQLYCSFHLSAAHMRRGTDGHPRLCPDKVFDSIERDAGDADSMSTVATEQDEGPREAQLPPGRKPLPPALRPLEFPATFDVFLLGVRGLTPYLSLPILRPTVSLEVDGREVVRTDTGTGPDHSFGLAARLELSLPVDLRYLPPLVIKVHDDRVIAQVLAGSATVPLAALVPGGVYVRYTDSQKADRPEIGGMYSPWGPVHNDCHIWQHPAGRHVLFRQEADGAATPRWVIARRKAECPSMFNSDGDCSARLEESRLTVVACQKSLPNPLAPPIDCPTAAGGYWYEADSNMEAEVLISAGDHADCEDDDSVGSGSCSPTRPSRIAKGRSLLAFHVAADSSSGEDSADGELGDAAQLVHSPPRDIAALRVQNTQSEARVLRQARAAAGPPEGPTVASCSGGAIDAAIFRYSPPASDDEAGTLPPRGSSATARPGLGHLKAAYDPANDSTLRVLDDDALLGSWLKAFSRARVNMDTRYYIGKPLEDIELHSPGGTRLPKGFHDPFSTFPLMRGVDDNWVNVGVLRAAVSVCPNDQMQPRPTRSQCGPVTHAMQAACAVERVKQLGQRQVPVRVFVYVVRCVELQRMDSALSGGAADPYLKVSISPGGGAPVSDSKSYRRGGVHFGELDPEFMQSTTLEGLLPRDRELRVAVWDHDAISRDELIGFTTVSLEDRYFSRRFQCAFLWNKGRNPDILEGVVDGKGQPVERTWPYACHIERRPLYNPAKSSRVETGYVDMWVDIIPVTDGAELPMGPWRPPEELHYDASLVPRLSGGPVTYSGINLTFPAPEHYELRVILWNARNVVLQDTNLAGERMSDILVQALIPGSAEKAQQSDVHYRSKDGKGNFNWRFKFPILYVRHERRIIPDPSADHFRPWRIRRSPEKVAPVLSVRLLDSDMMPFSDDLLGAVDIPLDRSMRGATDDGYVRPLGLFRRVETTGHGPRKSYVFGEHQTPKIWFPCHAQLPAAEKQSEGGAHHYRPGCLHRCCSCLCDLLLSCFTACSGRDEQLEQDRAAAELLVRKRAPPPETPQMRQHRLRYSGEVQLSLQLVPWDKAQQEEYQAGYGRAEPNRNPTLQDPQRPGDSFLWWQHPLKSIQDIVVPNVRPCGSAVCCCVLCTIVIAVAVWVLSKLLLARAGAE